MCVNDVSTVMVVMFGWEVYMRLISVYEDVFGCQITEKNLRQVVVNVTGNAP